MRDVHSDEWSLCQAPFLWAGRSDLPIKRSARHKHLHKRSCWEVLRGNREAFPTNVPARLWNGELAAAIVRLSLCLIVSYGKVKDRRHDQ